MAFYSQNPIQEAIFDVHVAGGSASALEIDDRLRKIRFHYSKRQEVIDAPGFEFKVAMGEQPSFHVGSPLHGFRYANEDENCWFEARVNGFSFNRLAPYTTWEEFSAQARELWEAYRVAREPQVVTRIGLRYINQFAPPLDESEGVMLSDYFTLFPVWPNALPALNGFNLQMASPQEDLEATLLLTMSTLNDAETGKPLLLLDIDLFKPTRNLDAQDTAAFWAIADALRTRKNHVFEQCINDATRELIR